MIIKNASVFTKDCTFQLFDIVVENNIITGLYTQNTLQPMKDQIVIDASGKKIIPGLTDIHFHGCVGYDFCDGTSEAIRNIAAYELSHGITTICPATMTLPDETLISICNCASLFNQSSSSINEIGTSMFNMDRKSLISPLIGINLEGPFLSVAKKGAQNAKYIKNADVSLLENLQNTSGNLVKLVAIAPEEDGALDCIKQCSSDFKFSVAHTNANYEIAKQAMDLGATHVTHLYNAMPGFTHREPGVIGAAFDTPTCNVELICDGVHIAPSAVRATFQLFGDDRVILISDSMMATGMEDGQYSLGGQAVTVTGNLATLESGTIAGSVTNLFDCMKTAMSMGITPEIAIKAATMNPAKSIGIFDKYGSIEAGKIANLLILNNDYSLESIILQGIPLPINDK